MILLTRKHPWWWSKQAIDYHQFATCNVIEEENKNPNNTRVDTKRMIFEGKWDVHFFYR